jgi:hypothetical protein
MTASLAMMSCGAPSAMTPALGHDDDPVADVADHVHVVLDEQDGHPVLAQLLDVAEQRLRERRVHAGHRLVEHDHLGLDHEGARHLEQLALAAGHRAGEVVALLVELEAPSSSSARSVLAFSCERHMAGTMAARKPSPF